MLNRYTLVLLYISIFLSCRTGGKQLVNVNNNNLIGCWKQKVNEISYPTLYFARDSTAVFTSKADTVYRFKYWTEKGTLMLVDNNNKVYECLIIGYSDSVFSFRDEVVNKKVLSYQRDTCLGNVLK